jgi:hypothetical protein
MPSKKIFFILIVLFSIAFASCGSEKNYYSSKSSKKGCGCPSGK